MGGLHTLLIKKTPTNSSLGFFCFIYACKEAITYNTLKVIAAAKVMYSYLVANGYKVGARVPLWHDLGDHMVAYMVFGEVALLPRVSTRDYQQMYLAESLADLVRYNILKGVVTDRLLLYGNTSGDAISTSEYEEYVEKMLNISPKLLGSLKWWYRQIS